jgi:hypothetical protein
MQKLYIMSLFGIAMLGAVSQPAMADNAVIQRNTQDIYVEGVNNGALQVNEQMNWNRRVNVHGQVGDEVGVIQDSAQVGTLLGQDNATYQHNTQLNVTERVNQNRHLQQRRAPISISQD